MNLIANLLWFEMRRFGYPLTNDNGAIDINNLLITAFQPIFILIDIISLPFLLTIETIRFNMIKNGKHNVTKSEKINNLETFPKYLANGLSYLLLQYIEQIDDGIAHNMTIDPKRCFWYSYMEYYYLVIDIEHAEQNK